MACSSVNYLLFIYLLVSVTLGASLSPLPDALFLTCRTGINEYPAQDLVETVHERQLAWCLEPWRYSVNGSNHGFHHHNHHQRHKWLLLQPSCCAHSSGGRGWFGSKPRKASGKWHLVQVASLGGSVLRGWWQEQCNQTAIILGFGKLHYAVIHKKVHELAAHSGGGKNTWLSWK